MELTNELLESFAGGQIVINDEGEGNLYRGEIKSLGLSGNLLVVTFNWLARCVDPIRFPDKWIKDSNGSFMANLKSYAATDLGDGRISLYYPLLDETVTLIPVGGDIVNPAKMDGLVL